MATIVTRSGKGSALTHTEMDANFNNLNAGLGGDVVDDLTPQLGGNLDLNGKNITGTGAIPSANLSGALPAISGAALTNLPGGGKVLQVVTAITSAETTSTTATYADTGLTATITPTLATSTILVSVHQNGLRHYGGSTDLNLYLQKDGVNWKFIGERISNVDSATPAANSVGGAGGQYLDSPADTSAHTYKTQFNNRLATGSVRVQDGGSVSTITLMEIGA